MPEALTLATTLLAIPALMASILSQVEVWQRKEYRVDRLLAGLRGPELRARLYPYAAALIAVCIGIYPIAVVIILTYHVWRITWRGIARPKPTMKAAVTLMVTAAAALGVLGILMSNEISPVAAWSLTLLTVPVCAAAGVIFANSIGGLRKRMIIRAASAARRKASATTVIGITGSYGKTSTKHFLSQILPGAAATKEHRNAEFPVAQDMLAQLTAQPSMYIVEMGAYRRGEIAALAKLTKPRIGVITAIGNQHVATFGSPEKILAAKWELIEALPRDGVAVLNADDAELTRHANAVPGRAVIWYSITKPADVYADSITVLPRSLSCRLHVGNSVRDLSIPLAGEGSLASVVAAAAAAHALGTSPDDIFDRLAYLSPYPQTMEIIETTSGSKVIDDSYSANEQGVIAALKHLTVFSEEDKRVIMVPLIELGSQEREVHQRIGHALAATGARVYVYGRAHERELTAQVPSGKIHFYTTPAELLNDATQNMTDKTVVLLEGRLPEVVRKAFI